MKATPSSPRLGAITKARSTHARRLLVEAAYHYRRGPVVGEASCFLSMLIVPRARASGRPATSRPLAIFYRFTGEEAIENGDRAPRGA
jgi:hypothetical protein